MSHTRNALAAKDSHILTLRAVIAVLVLICAGLWYGWQSAPERLTIHNPPDLRTGSTRAWWEVPPPTAYAFGLYVWTQLNRWPRNGEADYPRNLHAYQALLTESCRAELQADAQRRERAGELRNRSRGIYEIPGRGYSRDAVTIESRDSWIVRLDMGIEERYAGEPVRDLYIRYPLRVVRMDVDPEYNPWGLQLDCFEGQPQRLQLPNQVSGEGR